MFVAAISRLPHLDGVLQERLYEGNPAFLSLLASIEPTGDLPPVVPAGFVGWSRVLTSSFHRCSDRSAADGGGGRG